MERARGEFPGTLKYDWLTRVFRLYMIGRERPIMLRSR
jgi:hypothetical protein